MEQSALVKNKIVAHFCIYFRSKNLHIQLVVSHIKSHVGYVTHKEQKTIQ